MAVVIRLASDEDLTALARLWSQLDAFHRGLGFDFPHPDDSEEKWIASFARTLGRYSFVWVAEQAGQIDAFLLARVKQSPPFLGSVQVGEISDLYVDASLRGQGAGAQLVAAALDKFRELDLHSVEVQIQAGNDSGLDFWRKQGFDLDLTQVRKTL